MELGRLAAGSLCRKRHASVEEAEQDVGEARGSPNGPDHRQRGAHGAHGFLSLRVGRGHPEQLNLGDCFAYAVTKNARTALLFNGEDFDKTDNRPDAQSR